MDERALLLLGLLMMNSQHGYQINEFIEKNLGRIANIKKATAYAMLDRLGQSGYVTVHGEQEGNRPPRKVYTITEKGERRFRELLRENLAEADSMQLPGNIGLMFLDHLSPQEVVDCLAMRLKAVKEQIASYERAPRHTYNRGASLAVEHVLALLAADHDWLVATIERLRHGSG